MFDPMNVDEIADAIKRMCEDEKLRASLAEGAINTAKRLTISARADKILEFIKSKI